ncbi:MAG: PEP/pyruvate-binding domain-containing protein [Chloroflexi bacterium]|nr:PEP/pyruvate-binding domain-containing protein [Chloroflexota bacterium]
MDSRKYEIDISIAPTHKTSERLLNIYLTLGQYPILRNRIRELMREELFIQGIIEPLEFEQRVRSTAMQSQESEGLHNPPFEEPEDVWQKRLENVRDQLTDVMYSLQLPYENFEEQVTRALNERGIKEANLTLSLNPELASRDLVFQQARTIENMPEDQRKSWGPRLEESKVVIIRSMISDQLQYVNIAKDWFSVSDLEEIRNRKIGAGRIGGKSAGMILAYTILKKSLKEAGVCGIRIPESYYIGATEFYPFMSSNDLMHWLDQKYKTEEEMRADFTNVVKEFEAGHLTHDISEKLTVLLEKVGKKPLIVRSSSLLEDNFGTAFAGKYESFYLPNQGTPEENLHELTRAIGKVYASGFNPNALLYRRQKGLQDYDERMAILIQVVEGEQMGRYYLPHAAGVAFSRNTYRWMPEIRAEDGFVRLVWGLGTRAVDRVGNDFPRLVALSHPQLRPSADPDAIRRYSQHFVDLIDLQENKFLTLPVKDILTTDYPPLRYIAQVDQDGYFSSIRSLMLSSDTSSLVLTFDELLQRTSFASQMKKILQTLEKIYQKPVDVEFTLEIKGKPTEEPELTITVLQCRPQSYLMETENVKIPVNLDSRYYAFSTHFVVPQGFIDNVEYVIFVPPEHYFSLPTAQLRKSLGREVGKLNAALKGYNFICVGPGRWGSSNPDLGVTVDYGDIYNSRALVELAGEGVAPALEPSLGTHFFQDLMESQIYPLGILLDRPDTVFNHGFFYNTPDHLSEWTNLESNLTGCLRLIKVSDYLSCHHLTIVMNSETVHAVGYFSEN